MPAIMALARQHGLWVIEDCAQAHGAEISGRPVGSFGDISAFSFCQDKIFTTGGEGGLIAMDSETLWAKAWSRKDHGKSHDAVFRKHHPPGFRWLHETIGTNWRMTSMQAVLGLIQLRRLAEWQAQREKNAMILHDAFRDLEALRTPHPPVGTRHAYYRFYSFVRADKLESGFDRDKVVAEINAAGIPCFSGSCSEIYLEKAFTDNRYGPDRRLPVARELGETSVAFLVDPSIDTTSMKETGRIVRQIVLSVTRSGRNSDRPSPSDNVCSGVEVAS
jgi:dTDP-4-amino-4,6-dideoxygalactose transaminase